jgi:hypothetical protein
MTSPLGTPRGRYDEYSSKVFPQLRNQGLCRSGEEQTIRLKVVLASFATAPDNLYMVPRPSFALRAATWNLHTTQPSTLFPTYDEVVNLTGLLETKGTSVSSGK